MRIGQAGARPRAARRLVVVAVVSVGLVVASGAAAGAGEVPGFRTDTGAPGVFLGADDVPGVGDVGDAGVGGAGAFTFGTTPVATVPLAAAGKGDKQANDKTPVGAGCPWGEWLCVSTHMRLPGTVNSVYYDPSLPSPARDAAQWAASLISDRTVVKFVPASSWGNADVVVRMRPLNGPVDERGYAQVSCVVAPVTGLCGQRAVTLDKNTWGDLAPVSPPVVDFSCDQRPDPAGCRKEETDERAFQQAADDRRNDWLATQRRALMLEQFKKVVGFPPNKDLRIDPWFNTSNASTWLNLRPEEIKAINDAYAPRTR